MKKMKLKKRKVWKGGPRSKRSYVMDYHRQSSEPHELRQQKKGKRGVTKVRPHYRKVGKNKSTKVKPHRRRFK
jgi:hypothetical protein